LDLPTDRSPRFLESTDEQYPSEILWLAFERRESPRPFFLEFLSLPLRTCWPKLRSRLIRRVSSPAIRNQFRCSIDTSFLLKCVSRLLIFEVVCLTVRSFHSYRSGPSGMRYSAFQNSHLVVESSQLF